MAEKPDIETVEYGVGQRQGSQARKNSVTGSITKGFSTSGRRASDVRDIGYVDHRENDDRADVAKGRDAAAFGGNYWYSANFIGTMLAIGFSFMAGIGGRRQGPLASAMGSTDSGKQVMVLFHPFSPKSTRISVHPLTSTGYHL